MCMLYFLPTNSSQVRINRPPYSHAAFPQALTDSKLQVQQWDSFKNQQDEEWNHKCSWKYSIYIVITG